MTEKVTVVVDDLRTFDSDEDIIYLRNAKDAIFFIFERFNKAYMDPITDLYLDHDLGYDEDMNKTTIMPVVDFLVFLAQTEKSWTIVHKIFVHSQNPVGVENVVRALRNYYDVTAIPTPRCKSW